MGVHSDNSVQEAVAKLLTPQEEQGEVKPEQETLETKEEVEVEDQEDLEVEDESDDLEDDEPSEDSDEEDEPEEEDEEPGEFFTVKVDGEEYEVNLEELKKGYQLEKNYTKKAQQLAEERKELESLKSQLSQERDNYLRITEMVAAQATAELNNAKKRLAEIDKNDDPLGYLTAKEDVLSIEEKLREQISNYERAQTEQQKVSQEHMQRYLSEQQEILARELEGWNDPETSQAVKEGIKKFALTQGYTEEELASVSSARDIIVLNKAKMYDDIVARRAKVKDKKSPKKPVARVKSSKPEGEKTKRARAVKAQREQLRRSGSVRDATRLLEDLMTNRKPIKK